MKLILTGATGFAGGEVLRQALADPAVERVTVLTRRPLDLTHAKLNEVIVRDFLDYSSVRLDNADACIWCLGVSQSQVGKEQYVVITHDYAAKERLAGHCMPGGRVVNATTCTEGDIKLHWGKLALDWFKAQHKK